MTPFRFWLTIARLGLVQASIGAIVVFATSTLNRVMVVEFALPAIVPGALVAFHYAIQMARPRWGHGSDRGDRRSPWIVGGMAALAGGAVLAALATVRLAQDVWSGLALAVVAYALIGAGVGAAGTSLLVLLAQLAGEARRAAAATTVWMMMIAGFVITAGVAGTMLSPFSPARLIETAIVIAAGALVVACLAIWGVEARQPTTERPGPVRAEAFGPALREVWEEPTTRLFTIFVFVSMLAYSAQELVLEPFAGTVFGLVPAASAKLAGLQHGGLLAGMVTFAIVASVTRRPVFRSMRLWTSAGCAASAIAVVVTACVGAAVAAPMLNPAVFVLGVANGAFSIAAVAAMMQLAGHGRPGRNGVRMGLWGAAQAIAFACGGLLGTGAVDLARLVIAAPAAAYAVVFAGEAVLFCAAAVLALRALPGTAEARQAASAAERRRWAT